MVDSEARGTELPAAAGPLRRPMKQMLCGVFHERTHSYGCGEWLY